MAKIPTLRRPGSKPVNLRPNKQPINGLPGNVASDTADAANESVRSKLDVRTQQNISGEIEAARHDFETNIENIGKQSSADNAVSHSAIAPVATVATPRHQGVLGGVSRFFGHASETVKLYSERAMNLDMAVMFVLAPVAAVTAWVGQKLAFGSMHKAGTTLGKVAAIPQKELGVIAGSMGVDGVMRSASNGVAGVIAKPVELVTKVTGARWAGDNFHVWRANKNFGKAQNWLAKVRNVPAELAPHVDVLKSAVAGATHAGEFASHEGASAAMAKIAELTTHAPANPKPVVISKELNRFMHSAGKSIEHHKGSLAWKNVAQSVKNTPSAISKMTLSHTLVNAGFAGFAAASTLMEAKGFAENLEALRNAYARRLKKNPDEISTYALLTETLPPTLASARSHLLWSSGLKGAIQSIGLGLAIRLFFKKNASFIGMMATGMAPQVIASGADLWMGDSPLPIYTSFNEKFDRGQLSAQDYTTFIMTTNPMLRNHRSGPQFAMALAEQYLAEKTTADQIMIEFENGKQTGRLNAIADAHDAAHAPAVAVDPLMPAQPHAQVERAAIGPKTAQELHRRAQVTAQPILTQGA